MSVANEDAPVGQELIMDDDDFGGFYEEGPHAGAMYLHVFNGRICQKSKVPVDMAGWDPEDKPVKTNHPITKAEVKTWTHPFDKVVARIIGVNKVQKTFEGSGNKVTQYMIVLMAGKKKAILQLTYMDTVLKRFLKVAPNIKWDQHILISAWSSTRDGKQKQAVSFRQGKSPTDRDVDNWEKVPEYWDGPRDEQKKLVGEAKGEDGTVLPKGIHDEDDDTWDYKAQNKFLVKYFVQNVLPKVQEIEKQFVAVPAATSTGADTPEFSGPTKAASAPAPASTEPPAKPDDPKAEGVADAMTGTQTTEIKHLCEVLGRKTEKVSQKFFEISFHELNKDAAAWLIWKLNKIMAKKIEAGEIEAPAPPPPPKPKTADPDDDDDDDDSDWGAAEVPAGTKDVTPAKKAKSDDDDDDDDDTPF